MGQPGDPQDPNQGYAPPDHGGYPQPGYGPPPAYGYGHQYLYGPPVQPYPYGYPPAPGERRPGTATAAAVLGYVTAGILIAAGIVLLILASELHQLYDLTGGGHTLVTAEVAFDGALNFVAAGLLIAGGVSFLGRNPTGRVLLSIGGGIVVGESVYWVVRGAPDSPALFWALVFAALAVVALALAWTTAVGRWLRPQS